MFRQLTVIPKLVHHLPGRYFALICFVRMVVLANVVLLTGRTYAAPMPEPKLLSKEVFVPFDGKRPAATGFVTYVSKTEPVLMHCHGWEDYSDGYDDYSVSLSEDNGKTWSAKEVRWKSSVVPEGRLRYAEPAAFFDPDTEKLIVLTDRILYPNDKLDTDAEYMLVVDVYHSKTRTWSERRELKFSDQRSPAMSFSFPLKTRSGRLLFPGQRQKVRLFRKSHPLQESPGAGGRDGHSHWRIPRRRN